MDHEVGGVGFDYLCCLGFADDMALSEGLAKGWWSEGEGRGERPCLRLALRMRLRRSRGRLCNLRCLLLLLHVPSGLGEPSVVFYYLELKEGAVPLWNFSSIGGTSFRTLRRISRVALDILTSSCDIRTN